MNVRCGNHGTETVYHASAAEVRACFQGGGSAFVARQSNLGDHTVLDRVAPHASPAGVADWDRRPSLQEQVVSAHRSIGRTSSYAATEKQVNFINSLLAERGKDPLSNPGSLTKQGASDMITRLKAMPVSREVGPRPVESRSLPQVPEGRYAVVGDDGVTRFYKVDCPTEGRWAGRTFVKIQASADLHPVRDFSARKAVLEAIAKDPREASLRYGREIGSCGVCGRTLTDESSRAAGIGPICSAKTGW